MNWKWDRTWERLVNICLIHSIHKQIEWNKQIAKLDNFILEQTNWMCGTNNRIRARTHMHADAPKKPIECFFFSSPLSDGTYDKVNQIEILRIGCVVRWVAAAVAAATFGVVSRFVTIEKRRIQRFQRCDRTGCISVCESLNVNTIERLISIEWTALIQFQGGIAILTWTKPIHDSSGSIVASKKVPSVTLVWNIHNLESFETFSKVCSHQCYQTEIIACKWVTVVNCVRSDFFFGKICR